MWPSAQQVELIEVDRIEEALTPLRVGADPERLRELADSIAAVGLLQPIGVVRSGDDGGYRLVWGSRRLAAHRLLRRRVVRAVVVDDAASELDLSVVENLHRDELSPVEEAAAIANVVGLGVSVSEVAHRWRKSASWVQRRLDMVEWPEDVREAVHRRVVSVSAAHWFAQVDSAEYRTYLLGAAESSGCTAATARAWWADYEAHKPRILANQATVEELKQRVESYVVLAVCEGCGAREDLAKTRTYRVCAACSAAVERSRRGEAAPDG